MAIYLSAGTATIAALMTVERDAHTLAERTVRALAPETDLARITRRCERAVVTAYRDLRAHGAADASAFQACATLYRIHHPQASRDEARALVAAWVEHHLVRGKDGPTQGCECD